MTTRPPLAGQRVVTFPAEEDSTRPRSKEADGRPGYDRARGGVEASLAERQAAASRLIQLFQVIGDLPPRSLIGLACPVAPQPPATGSWGVLDP